MRVVSVDVAPAGLDQPQARTALKAGDDALQEIQVGHEVGVEDSDELPGAPLIMIMFLSQTINGMLLPVILIIMLKLVNDKELMGEYVNSKRMNMITWITTAVLIVLTALLLLMGVMKMG